MNKISLLMAALGLAEPSILDRINKVNAENPMNVGSGDANALIAIEKAKAKRQRKAAKAAALLRKE